MTYELRRSPELAFQCFAPKPPADITPDQVRTYLAEHPEFKVVQLSSGWMKRPKAVQDQWRKLDDDLWEAGIDVYFTPGGTCTWEAGFSDGKPPGPTRRFTVPTLTAAAPLEGVTTSSVGFHPPGDTPGEVFHPHGDDPPTVATDLGDQVVMADPDGEPLIDIIGPEDAPSPEGPDQSEHAANLEPSGPVGGVTDPTAADRQGAPVLQREEVETANRRVAAQPGIGGYRKIAAALAVEGITLSHMKVKRVLEKTPVGAS